jgi:uncharacterized protein YdeI (YjbR/CyaY-like superfamily)
MGTKEDRVDAYIEKSADFLRPILRHIRQLIHAACPQAQETIKWRHPTYEYRGILCITPAFKHHCALIFWRKSIRQSLEHSKTKVPWGNIRRIAKLSDLPKDSILTRSIKESAKLNEMGEKHRVSKPTKRHLVIPPYITKALERNKKASAVFQGLSPSHQREYVLWIAQAKREETRDKRLAGMLKMLTEGKTRNWKYER